VCVWYVCVRVCPGQGLQCDNVLHCIAAEYYYLEGKIDAVTRTKSLNTKPQKIHVSATPVLGTI
jgi:hypothetical protein